MSAKKAYSRYRQATVDTASPGKLVVMLYDGAIRFLGEALEHIEANKPKETHFAIVKAENIICELMSCLDLDKGGKIAENLLALYEFMHLRLVEANLEKDGGRVRDVIALLQDLRDAWAKAVNTNAQEQFQAKQEALPASQRTPSLEQDTSAYKARKKQPAQDGTDSKEPPPEMPKGFSIVS